MLIKTKVRLLMLVSVLGIIACIFAFIISISSLGRMNQQADQTSQAVKKGTEIIYHFSNARNFELDYIYVTDSNVNSESATEEIEVANEKINELNNLTDNEVVLESTNELADLFASYLHMYNDLVIINDQIGSPFSGGILTLNANRYTLQTRYEFLMRMLESEEDLSTFQKKYMSLLAAENDFFKFPNQTFYNDFIQEVDNIEGDLNSFESATEDLALFFGEGLNDYRNQVETLADLFFSRQELNENFTDLVVKIDAVVTDIEQELNDDFTLIQNEKGNLTQRVYTTLAIISTIIIIVLIVSSVLLNRTIVQSVSRLQKGAKIIGEGDLTFRVDEGSKDELGDLARTFNQMAEKVLSSFSIVNKASENLSQTSLYLENFSKEALQQTEEVGISLEEMATGAQSQAQDIDFSAQTIKTMVDQVEEVNQSAKKINKQVGYSLKNGQNGLIASKELGETSIKFINLAQTLVDKVEKVTVYSSQIGTIVETIEQLSDSTNLLALNASIEAARAGEYGRGFAVVANEVKVLAEKSKQEAKHIHDVISEMNNQMEELSTGATYLDKYSDKQKRAVDNTVLSIKDSMKQIEIIKTYTDHIDKSLTNLNSSSVEVGNKIQDVSSVSEEFAATSQEVAAYSADQIESVVKVSESAKELNQLAQSLTEEMMKFILHKGPLQEVSISNAKDAFQEDLKDTTEEKYIEEETD